MDDPPAGLVPAVELVPPAEDFPPDDPQAARTNAAIETTASASVRLGCVRADGVSTDSPLFLCCTPDALSDGSTFGTWLCGVSRSAWESCGRTSQTERLGHVATSAQWRQIPYERYNLYQNACQDTCSSTLGRLPFACDPLELGPGTVCGASRADQRDCSLRAPCPAWSISGPHAHSVLAQDSVYDEVVERAKTIAEFAPQGDPLDPSGAMGPVSGAGAFERIMGYIDIAKNDGSSRLVAGGTRLGGELEPGFFIRPTIFAHVDNSSRIAPEEVFGPVLSIIGFKDEAEAAYLHTRDLALAHRVAADLDAGWIGVNSFPPAPAVLTAAGFPTALNIEYWQRWRRGRTVIPALRVPVRRRPLHPLAVEIRWPEEFECQEPAKSRWLCMKTIRSRSRLPGSTCSI